MSFEPLQRRSRAGFSVPAGLCVPSEPLGGLSERSWALPAVFCGLPEQFRALPAELGALLAEFWALPEEYWALPEKLGARRWGVGSRALCSGAAGWFGRTVLWRCADVRRPGGAPLRTGSLRRGSLKGDALWRSRTRFSGCARAAAGRRACACAVARGLARRMLRRNARCVWSGTVRPACRANTARCTPRGAVSTPHRRRSGTPGSRTASAGHRHRSRPRGRPRRTGSGT